jgi:hypothetical protein
MDWIHLARDRGKWWALVNTEMPVRSYKMQETSSRAEKH